VVVQVLVVAAVPADCYTQVLCQSMQDNHTLFKLVPVVLAAMASTQPLTDILLLVAVLLVHQADQVVAPVGADNINGVLLHLEHPAKEIQEEQDTITQIGVTHMVVAAVLDPAAVGEHRDQEDHQAAVDQVLLTQLTEHQHTLPVVAEVVKVVAHGMVAVVPVEVAVTVQEQIIQVVVEVMTEAVQALLSSVIQEHNELQVVL
jgi:hypothetical protein